VLGTLAKICVSKEFNLLATNKTSPVVNYLRELAATNVRHMAGQVSARWHVSHRWLRHGHVREPSVIAPVMSQPSLPFPTNAEHRSALGLSDADLAVCNVEHKKTCA